MSQETLPEKTAPDRSSLKGMLADVNAKKRFEEILGKKAPGFISSIISVYQNSKQLQKVDAASIIAAAAKAAALDLPIEPSLGQAAIVPYKDQAQFQIMARGFIQLAHRTGKYRRMNLARVYEGQLVSHDRFKGTVKLDEKLKKSDKVEGYYFIFELTNGYVHETYWSAQDCVDHGWKFSKSFSLYGSGLWTEDPLMPKKSNGRGGYEVLIKEFKGFVTDGSGLDAMCAKTIVKNTLVKWGPLSTDMQTAREFDQAAVTAEGKPVYIDSTAEQVDGSTTEKPEMPKPAGALPEPAVEKANADGTPNEVVLPGGSYVVTKAGDGCKITARNGAAFKNDDPGVAKLALSAMEGGKNIRLSYWPSRGDQQLESLEVVKA